MGLQYAAPPAGLFAPSGGNLQVPKDRDTIKYDKIFALVRVGCQLLIRRPEANRPKKKREEELPAVVASKGKSV